MSDLREAERITEMSCDLRYAGYSFASEAQQMANKVIELIIEAEAKDKEIKRLEEYEFMYKSCSK